MKTEPNAYHGFRFPAEIIAHAVWLYHCFSLSLRDVETILAQRGIVVSYESIRTWGLRFGRAFANALKRRRPRPGDKWHLDEQAGNAPQQWRREGADYGARRPRHQPHQPVHELGHHALADRLTSHSVPLKMIPASVLWRDPFYQSLIVHPLPLREATIKEIGHRYLHLPSLSPSPDE